MQNPFMTRKMRRRSETLTHNLPRAWITCRDRALAGPGQQGPGILGVVLSLLCTTVINIPSKSNLGRKVCIWPAHPNHSLPLREAKTGTPAGQELKQRSKVDTVCWLSFPRLAQDTPQDRLPRSSAAHSVLDSPIAIIHQEKR